MYHKLQLELMVHYVYVETRLKRVKIGHIGKAILGIVAVTGVVGVLALFPGVTYAIAPFIKKKKYVHKRAIQKSIDSLIRNGLLKKSFAKDGSVKIELTKRGRWEAMLTAPSIDTRSKKWDRLWRVVVFDIPQDKQKERTELRRAMRLFGFKLLQKSVWVYPFPCDDFVLILKERLGISHDVLYMKVSYIENDTHLRKEFKI